MLCPLPAANNYRQLGGVEETLNEVQMTPNQLISSMTFSIRSDHLGSSEKHQESLETCMIFMFIPDWGPPSRRRPVDGWDGHPLKAGKLRWDSAGTLILVQSSQSVFLHVLLFFNLIRVQGVLVNVGLGSSAAFRSRGQQHTHNAHRKKSDCWGFFSALKHT